MESNGVPGEIHLSESAAMIAKTFSFDLTCRGLIYIKVRFLVVRQMCVRTRRVLATVGYIKLLGPSVLPVADRETSSDVFNVETSAVHGI